LADGDAMVRGGAARALAAIGPDAGGAAGALAAALAVEKDRDVVIGILDACGEIGPGAIQAAQTLVGMLAAADAEIREAAVSALGELGPQATATAGDATAKLLEDADPFVRVAAVGALAGLGRPAPRARAILLEALAGTDEDLQASAAEVIGDRGKAAAGFSAALARVAAAAADPHTRAAAITAIGDIGAADQPAALGKALGDDDADVRHAAAYAINDLPEIAPGLAAEIITAADDDDVRVRMEIAPLLAALGTPEAKKALQALADDDDDNVADVAQGVLSGKGTAAGR
ncbi:MAG: HEAT repeat domain-containing protein, partial [Planctomycetaceae bacterium]